MMLDRRAWCRLAIGGSANAWAARAFVGSARAGSPPVDALALASDDGSPIRNRALPAEAFAGLAGLQRIGGTEPDIVIGEVFDYNCGYCRSAAVPLDALVERDGRVALELLHHPILSPASRAVAILQQAVFHVFGPASARALHLALLGHRGFLDEQRVRAIARAEGIDLDAIDAPAVAGSAALEVDAQTSRAHALGIRVTPTFAIAGRAFIGWPGPSTIAGMIAEARRCGRLRCD